MPFGTMRFNKVQRRPTTTTSVVDLLWYEFDVTRVDAGAITTQMVAVKPRWDRPTKLLVDATMGTIPILVQSPSVLPATVWESGDLPPH